MLGIFREVTQMIADESVLPENRVHFDRQRASPFGAATQRISHPHHLQSGDVVAWRPSFDL
jgi:hypothetical protein